MSKQATRGLPFRDWPEADHELWKRLTLCGGPFGVDGALSNLRPASLETLRNAYGFFLRHAERSGVDLQSVYPPDRATLEILRSYHASLHGLSPRTQFGYFCALKSVLARGYPERDWDHLQAAVRNLGYKAEQSQTFRAKGAVPSTLDLKRLASDVASAGRRCTDIRQRAEAQRDSLMLLLLALHPLRRKNFAELEIGTSIAPQEIRFVISLEGSEMKGRRPLSFTLSAELSDAVEDYIKNVRSLFPGGQDRQGRLWLRFTYGPWEKAAIGRHISRLTEHGLGRRVTPHLFRHAAATTNAESVTGDARITRPLLGHATDTTSQRYYIQADQVSASRHYQKAIREAVQQGRVRMKPA